MTLETLLRRVVATAEFLGLDATHDGGETLHDGNESLHCVVICGPHAARLSAWMRRTWPEISSTATAGMFRLSAWEVADV